MKDFEEVKESIKVVEFLRNTLQKEQRFSTSVRANWVLTLNEILKDLTAFDFEEVVDQPKTKLEPKLGLTLEQLRGG